MGKKPPTYYQMPDSELRVAGLGEELDTYDLDSVKGFVCDDCGRLEGHKPNCPSDPDARVDEDEVDVEICSECGVADGGHRWDCSNHVEHGRANIRANVSDTKPGLVFRHRMQMFADYDDNGNQIPQPKCHNAPDCNHYECQ
jgi:hypothetical protein